MDTNLNNKKRGLVVMTCPLFFLSDNVKYYIRITLRVINIPCYETIKFKEVFHMMTDAEKRLIIDLELLYDKWSREWLERIHNDTQLSREDERVRLLELKKIITDHSGINANMEGYLK